MGRVWQTLKVAIRVLWCLIRVYLMPMRNSFRWQKNIQSRHLQDSLWWKRRKAATGFRRNNVWWRTRNEGVHESEQESTHQSQTTNYGRFACSIDLKRLLSRTPCMLGLHIYILQGSKGKWTINNNYINIKSHPIINADH